MIDCTQPESCFDGVDNDCNGQTDCADAACTPGAVCVDAPASSKLGVMVSNDTPCPEGFTGEELFVYRGITGGGGCAGCSCTPKPTDCTADLWYYTTPASCTNDVNQVNGTYAGEIGFACTPNPVNNGGLNFEGARVGPWKVNQSCSVDGVAAPEPASWKETRKFCRATGVGAGCPAGKACVPPADPVNQCALVSGSAVCEGYAFQQNDWFTGYSDTRSCGACSCKASGGDCNNVTLYIGSDYACDTGVDTPINEGGKVCKSIYSPPARLKGTPNESVCTLDTPFTGTLDPTGQSTVCCIH